MRTGTLVIQELDLSLSIKFEVRESGWVRVSIDNESIANIVDETEARAAAWKELRSRGIHIEPIIDEDITWVETKE